MIIQDNPMQIQYGNVSEKNATPLVLFHDGGGTCFSYQLLGELGRPVYGIQNPRLQTMRPWTGGLKEMASVYAQLLFSLPWQQGFILGGWSFGGLLALEVANILVHDLGIKVIGIIMIDTPCPLPPQQPDCRLVPLIPDLKETHCPELRIAVRKSFQNSRKMAEGWFPSLPRRKSIALPEVGLETGTIFNERRPSAPNIAAELNVCSDTRTRTWIPTVLLRATDQVLEGYTNKSRATVDAHREEFDLGWTKYGVDFPHRVLDISGHHFSIFHPDHINETTGAIREACYVIEGAV
ncbi:Alpha/Beta hydrolase protein [Hypoxylon sp. FL0890]|nr:Alpha/Beta hydrolase protein [Hypoxylon sp. FL0890]